MDFGSRRRELDFSFHLHFGETDTGHHVSGASESDHHREEHDNGQARHPMRRKGSTSRLSGSNRGVPQGGRIDGVALEMTVGRFVFPPLALHPYVEKDQEAQGAHAPLQGKSRQAPQHGTRLIRHP